MHMPYVGKKEGVVCTPWSLPGVQLIEAHKSYTWSIYMTTEGDIKRPFDIGPWKDFTKSASLLLY